MSDFTKGPWEFLGDADDFECRVRQKSSVKKGNGFISEITICDNIGDLGNALLIASAPDLLEALEFALNALAHCKADAGYSSMQSRAASIADKAIKKARGQS